MKYRFVEYRGDIYIVIGIGYFNDFDADSSPMFFEVIPLSDHSLIRSSLRPYTMNIPFSEAIEITDKNRLLALMVLYGQ
jgi:hypothetical protein